MTERRNLPPSPSGPELDHLTSGAQKIGLGLGNSAERLHEQADALEQVEADRLDYEFANNRLRSAMSTLGGFQQAGASNETSRYMQAGAFLLGLAVNALWISLIGIPMDPVTTAAVAVLIQGLMQALATLYNTKIAGRH